MRYYLIHVAGGIEPDLINVGYDTNSEDSRNRMAKLIHNDPNVFDEDDVLFWLDIDHRGIPEIGAYYAGFFKK